MDNLELICQKHYQDLLREEKLLQNYSSHADITKRSPNKASSLPFYASLVPIYEKLNHQELLLQEIEEQLKTKKQKNELRGMQQVLTNLHLDKSQIFENPIKKWHYEMIKYCKKFTESTETCANDRLYYNVSFSHNCADEEIELIKLSFSTRHCKKCLMLTIEVKSNKSGEHFEVIQCQSSLGFENLLSEIQGSLENRIDAKEFVETILWKQIKEIVDYI